MLLDKGLHRTPFEERRKRKTTRMELSVVFVHRASRLDLLLLSLRLLNESDALHDSEGFLLFCGLSLQFGLCVWDKRIELKRLRIGGDCPGIDFSGLQDLLGLLVVVAATTQGTE